MDSTHPVQTPLPLPQPLSSKSKLPIKRKTLPSSSHDPPLSPHPNPNFTYYSSSSAAAAAADKPPPFKFHRIWTEPDEIRFLQGLLDSASEGLVFPRDLHLFYDRFSTATSHPYTKSQLSEKLRRLRKKFRAVSSRILRGLDSAALSPHDRTLYDLSKKLWSPEFASVSPFTGNSSQGSGGDGSKIKVEEDAIRVNDVGFSPSLPLSANPNQNERCDCDHVGINVDGKMGNGCGGGKIGGVVAKIVLDVFDECLKEAKMWQGVLCSPDHKSSQSVENFGRRWQEQRALELDVFARRLRLVIEDSLHQH